MRKVILLILVAMVAALPLAQGQTPPSTEHSAPRKLTIVNKPWTGDFDKMLERRVIRVYAPFSRSLYFNDKGRERGIAVELVRDWERHRRTGVVEYFPISPVASRAARTNVSGVRLLAVADR